VLNWFLTVEAWPNEYLDDPLADNNEDTFKLRGAIVRAGRKRKRPGFQNSSGFNPKNFFNGITYPNSIVFKTSSVGFN
jgi:hypothetical protein